MVSFRFLVPLLIVGFTGSVLAREPVTWTFSPDVAVDYNYWSKSQNWVDPYGNHGVPEEGDSLEFLVAPAYMHRAELGRYMKRIHFGPNASQNIAHNGLYLLGQDQGGEGLWWEPKAASMWCQYMFDGDVIVNINSGVTITPGGFVARDSTRKARFTKIGAGTLVGGTSGYKSTNWTGGTIREGVFTHPSHLNHVLPNQDYYFDGTASSAWFKIANSNLTLRSCWFHSTTNTYANADGHGITDGEKKLSLTLTGTMPVDEQYFEGVIAGTTTFVWNPSESTKSFVLSRGKSTTLGSFIVSNGLMRVSNGATATALLTLEIDGPDSVFSIDADAGDDFAASELHVSRGGKIRLSAGRTLLLMCVKKDGVRLPGGVYAGADSTGSGLKVDWIEGAGEIRVFGRDESSATWTGAGSDTLVSTAANWAGNLMPNFDSLGLLVTFAAGGTSAKLAADFVGCVGGMVLSAPEGSSYFSLNADAGARMYLGAGGIRTAAQADEESRTYGIHWPIEVVEAQEWTTVRATDSLVMDVPISSSGEHAITKKGPGTLNLKAANTFKGQFRLEEGTVHVYDGQAFGDTALGTSLKLAKGNSIVFHGVTCPEDFQVTQLAGGTFELASGTTNTFVGLADLRDGANSFSFKVSSWSAGVFRGGLFNGGNFGIWGKGALIVEEKPMILTDRISMGNGSVLDLRVANNAIGVNPYLMRDSTLYTRVPYAINYGNDGAYNACVCMGDTAGGSLWDMCGCDQRVMEFSAYSGNPATVTSETAASLHLQFTANRSRDLIKYYSVTNYATFKGAAMLSYEGNREFCLMRNQESSGELRVGSGTLRFPAEGGSWLGATNVVVAGGTLSLLRNRVFGDHAAIDLSGRLELGEGVVQRCATLVTNGVPVTLPGTYGSSLSKAEFKDDERFAGKGILKVGTLGMCIFVR